MTWTASAPSNIALIKYMGKEGANQSVNPSLSMTLSAFRSTVEIERRKEGPDQWQPLPGSSPLRAESTARFLEFFQKLKGEVPGSFLLRSGNNFPSDAGLASSASSFAALTLAAHTAFADIRGLPIPPAEELARISRSGSGSSCRSFFSPWCAWEGDKIGPLPSRLPDLVDLVVVVDHAHKKVSSSEAHRRVRTSPLFADRVPRAQQRMQAMRQALASGDYRATAEISWAELWDMHSLFHTSTPPFFYFAPGTLAVLRWAEDFWEKHGHGPITTIDAGPNVHLLVPAEETARFRAELKDFQILESGA